jgi:hypothetical protein
MAKYRLTVEARDALKRKLREFVNLPDLAEAEEKLRVLIYAALDDAYLHRFPEDDMKVLARYNLTEREEVRPSMSVGVGEFRVAHMPFNRWEHYNPLTLKTYISPPMPRGMSFSPRLPQKLVKVWDDWCAAVEAYKTEYAAIVTAYEEVITKSKYLEEVEAVWPEASTIRSSNPRLLPVVVVTDKTMSIIENFKAMQAARAKKMARRRKQ